MEKQTAVLVSGPQHPHISHQFGNNRKYCHTPKSPQNTEGPKRRAINIWKAITMTLHKRKYFEGHSTSQLTRCTLYYASQQEKVYQTIENRQQILSANLPNLYKTCYNCPSRKN